jgi:putative oxidoreductase
MKNLRPIGRIIFALPFLFFGINHFVKFLPLYDAEFTTFIPLGPFTILLTGVLLIGASISIILKKYVKISATVLAGLLFLFIITIHIPHIIKGIQTEYALINLFKDLALMGGSLMIAGEHSEKENE